VLVCTDGLWNYLPEPEQLAPVALAEANGSALGAARALVQHALDAGGHDNITVAVVPCVPVA
jgi:serine/threonine protein phosphatase PrpC